MRVEIDEISNQLDFFLFFWKGLHDEDKPSRISFLREKLAEVASKRCCHLVCHRSRISRPAYGSKIAELLLQKKPVR